MSKTIKQLADELNVSRQYIHKVINLLPKNRQPKKVNNRYTVDTNAERNIKDYMKVDHTSSSTRKQSKHVDEVYGLQEKRITDLKEQNAFYKEQIHELQKRLENSQKLIDQEQQLHLTDQKRIERIEQPEEEQGDEQNNPANEQGQHNNQQPKKGLFKRLFGK